MCLNDNFANKYIEDVFDVENIEHCKEISVLFNTGKLPDDSLFKDCYFNKGWENKIKTMITKAYLTLWFRLTLLK